MLGRYLRSGWPYSYFWYRTLTHDSRGTLKGPANYRIQGIDRASHLLRDIIFTVLEEVGLTWSDLNVVVAGLAGVHEDFDEKRVKNSLLEVLPDNDNISIGINNDLYIALVGGIQKEYGIATNAGTGAIAIGVNHSGETYIGTFEISAKKVKQKESEAAK